MIAMISPRLLGKLARGRGRGEEANTEEVAWSHHISLLPCPLPRLDDGGIVTFETGEARQGEEARPMGEVGACKFGVPMANFRLD